MLTINVTNTQKCVDPPP